ncbi:MAG: hypothetical protein IJZ96_11725 [Lachnospiraceae bacterium]|nr:hypothetical protein [Lachnospiraceae bacterium]MBQ8317336.1 hypothetical protein [Lachnospiraceae bacterium]
MSNLFKSGIPGIKTIDSEPFVIDGNKKQINVPENVGKIIRPLDEAGDDGENIEVSNENEDILNEAMDIAKDLRDDAINRAAKIIEDAKAEAVTIKEHAYREAYNKGLADGSMEAMKRTDAYIENMHKEQELLFQKNQETLEANILDAQGKMVDLSCALIEKLTGILVDEYRPVMLHVINNALNESDSGKNLIIKVGEENYAYLMDNLDRITGAANPSITMELYGDSKLDRRQCLIESENGIIDLSMDIQVRKLITAIKLLSE